MGLGLVVLLCLLFSIFLVLYISSLLGRLRAQSEAHQQTLNRLAGCVCQLSPPAQQPQVRRGLKALLRLF